VKNKEGNNIDNNKRKKVEEQHGKEEK
jgi:hypothetical protein